MAFEPEMHFNIKEVAAMVGVVPATIRNWERAGLFTAKRSDSNYRYFDFKDIEFLKKIASYSSDGMNISFIKNMLKQDGGARVEESNDISTINTVVGDYSSKLHQCRIERGLTLSDVCSEIGISPSYLSRIEQGKCNITLSALQKLATFYGKDPDTFIDDNTEPSPIVKAGKGEIVDLDCENTVVRSQSNMSTPSFNVAIADVAPGGGSFKSHNHKTGYEVIHVLKGTICFTLDDSVDYMVEAGDSISFSATRLHKWHNPTKSHSEMIWYHSYL